MYDIKLKLIAGHHGNAGWYQRLKGKKSRVQIVLL